MLLEEYLYVYCAEASCADRDTPFLTSLLPNFLRSILQSQLELRLSLIPFQDVLTPFRGTPLLVTKTLLVSLPTLAALNLFNLTSRQLISLLIGISR